jgi:predicted RNA-binding Zn ribbon-like protein
MSHYLSKPRLATDLVNTFDMFASDELLNSVLSTSEFAVAHDFDIASVTSKDLHRLRLARPALRSAILTNDQASAVRTLNELLAAANPRPQLVARASDEWTFRYEDPAASLADRIVAEAAAELLEEIRENGMRRFNTCASSTCEDVFVDQSRNHSRRYCTQNVCGNRESQRAHRARQTDNPE